MPSPAAGLRKQPSCHNFPGGHILDDNFLVAHLAQVLPLGASSAVGYVDKFVENSKTDFLLQLAYVRGGLVGVELPAPIVKHEEPEEQEVDGGQLKIDCWR